MSKLVKTNSKYTVLGLMSGTSLDGLDMALCDFKKINDKWSYECVKARTIKYPTDILEKLKQATQLSGEKLSELDVVLGQWYGNTINTFISGVEVKPDFIASHGHTIFHQPSKKLTWQIGNGWEMLRASGIPVINDFRSKDVSLGGQGAPLVPIGDQLLFADYDYCINLGGIANISFDHKGIRIAYDIVPCNMVFNYLAQQKGQNFDSGGEIAKAGNIQQDLLKELKQWEYLHQSYPKTLGYEQVEAEIMPVLKRSEHNIFDLMATYLEFVALHIAESIKNKGKILITGGGAYNNHLITKLKSLLGSNNTVVIPDKELIDFKEAIIFAFLGVLRVRGEVNCLASVTGASSDNCGGIIYE